MLFRSPWRCKFCLTGNRLGPYGLLRIREDCLPNLLQCPETVDTIGIIGSALGEHPDIKFLLRSILQTGKRFSLSSLNIKALDDEFLQLLAQAHTHTLTLAPEAGTDRLRHSLGKEMTSEHITRAAEMIAAFDFPTLRLYFLVGVPGETQEDLQGIIDLTLNFREILKKKRPRQGLPRCVLGVNSFVPKKGTPFESHAIAPLEELQLKFKFLKNRLRNLPGISIHHDSPVTAHIETILSNGGRETAEFIELLHCEGNQPKKALKIWNKRTAPLHDSSP